MFPFCSDVDDVAEEAAANWSPHIPGSASFFLHQLDHDAPPLSDREHLQLPRKNHRDPNVSNWKLRLLPAVTLEVNEVKLVTASGGWNAT